jgi:hypothetical protein
MHWARIVGGCLFGLAILSFLSFAAGALILGGDALNGKVEGDRYFLRSGSEYTEVSEGVYRYSRVHAISLFVIFPLGIFGGGGLLAYADRVAKRRIAAWLDKREPLTARQFAERFFGPDSFRIELAAALRDVLQHTVGVDLAGLRPDDRLEDVSHGIYPGDPSLFIDIEVRLGVGTGLSDYERFQQAAQRVDTFEHLVDYIAACPKRDPTAEDDDADRPRGRLVSVLERVIGFIFGRGFFALLALCVLGIVLELLGFAIPGRVVLYMLPAGIGLGVAAAGLWLWLLAFATFRTRRHEGHTTFAWFGLIIWAVAGTFAAWCGISIILALVHHLPN